MAMGANSISGLPFTPKAWVGFPKRVQQHSAVLWADPSDGLVTSGDLCEADF